MISATSMWQQSISFSYNVTAVPADAGELVIQVSEFDLGEAPPEDSDLFLALDDVNITFCLPCDFDDLTTPGNLLLSSPSEVAITFGEVNQFTLQASSPLCPTLPLVFAIESGECIRLNRVQILVQMWHFLKSVLAYRIGLHFITQVEILQLSF